MPAESSTTRTELLLPTVTRSANSGGLQKDGDLWEQAWKAVLKRGPGNQDLRKVKGHATNQDVEKGKATKEDRHGNDKSDKIADEGVEAIGGRGLVKLGAWLEKRHDQYSKFMPRIQEMIVGIALAEKEERTVDKEIKKATLGYDPDKWLRSDVQIRDGEQEGQEYESIRLPPVLKGKHKFSQCQVLYQEIHAFIQQREWAPFQNDNDTGGTTWVELFLLFDLAGTRTEAGQHVGKNTEAKKRAEERSSKQNKTKCKQ